jgi:hypothetical protein
MMGTRKNPQGKTRVCQSTVQGKTRVSSPGPGPSHSSLYIPSPPQGWAAWRASTEESAEDSSRTRRARRTRRTEVIDRRDNKAKDEMVKHLDVDYFQDSRPTGLIPHFWDTIDVLGGSLGLGLITLGVFLFYLLVHYVVQSSRAKREKKKQR